MSEPITIRLATFDDTAVIVTHRRRMFEDMGHTDKAILDRVCEEFETWVRIRMAQGLFRTWLAQTAEGRVVASASLWLIDWPPSVSGTSAYRGSLFNVYTEPVFRRRGLGKQLTQTILDWCWTNDVDTVVLHATDQGRGVYESLGFTPTNEMRIFRPT